MLGKGNSEFETVEKVTENYSTIFPKNHHDNADIEGKWNHDSLRSGGTWHLKKRGTGRTESFTPINILYFPQYNPFLVGETSQASLLYRYFQLKVFRPAMPQTLWAIRCSFRPGGFKTAVTLRSRYNKFVERVGFSYKNINN